jgi:hypothetical protein
MSPNAAPWRRDLLARSGIAKAGFGLGDDRKRIVHKLGIEPQGILELNTIFRERGYRKDMGVKGAVAVLFNQRFIKSKKAATSNWANARSATERGAIGLRRQRCAICGHSGLASAGAG